MTGSIKTSTDTLEDKATGVKGNTNPFDDAVDEDVIVVDPQGNAIPVKEGNRLGGSKDGKCIQLKDAHGKQVGVRKDKHVATKSETCAIEGFNSRVRHYLARFHRTTFCYSKALYMVHATLTIFFTLNWERYY